MSEYLSFSKNFEVTVDNVDFREILKPSAILQYLQDIATIHAVRLGIGYESMKQQNKIWVLARLSFEVKKYPKLGDILLVKTFPKSPGLADAVRDFYIYDANGNNIISATSRWCVLDINSRTLQRCKPIFDALNLSMGFNAENSMDYPTPKLKSIEDFNQYEKSYEDFAKITDMDRNFHVNNAKYGDMIYNSFDAKFLKDRLIKRLDLNFISEMVAGDRFCVYKALENDSSYVEIKKENQTSIARAKINWTTL